MAVSGGGLKGGTAMRKKNRFYVAYGSNLNLTQMKRRCPGASVAGTAVLNDYRLLFRGGQGGAVATIEPFTGGSVPILLWDITPSDETSLDIYEGWPRLYRKEEVKVRLNGKTVNAMAYVMNEGRPLGQPGAFYYNTILEGYESAGFDPEVLKKATEDSAEIL